MLEAAQDEDRFTKAADFSTIDATLASIDEKVDKIHTVIANYAKGSYEDIPVEEEPPVTVTQNQQIKNPKYT